jgi:tRNA 2-selenouridine synthase
MFENLLALSLFREEKKGNPIWLEDESQRMGLLNLPQEFWTMMRNKPNHFIDVLSKTGSTISLHITGNCQKVISLLLSREYKKDLGGSKPKQL